MLHIDPILARAHAKLLMEERLRERELDELLLQLSCNRPSRTARLRAWILRGFGRALIALGQWLQEVGSPPPAAQEAGGAARS